MLWVAQPVECVMLNVPINTLQVISETSLLTGTDNLTRITKRQNTQITRFSHLLRIRPGNGEGLFLQPWSLHGALTACVTG